ncbi:MAG: hypothetical protein AB7K52_02725 [Phycisphaerales bacterium]
MPTPHSSLRFAAAACLAGAALLPAGCNIVGPAFFFIHGPEKVPAAFELPDDRTVVIFIDDRVPFTSRPVRETIGRAAEQALLDAGVVRDVVSSKAIQAVVARERFGKPLGIADIGKAVGADIVIYAWVDAFTLSVDTQTFSPAAALRVKVIDVASTERLFPAPDASEPWYPLAIQPAQQMGFRPSTPPEEDRARQDLANYVGLSLSRLFFEHERPKPQSRLDETDR